MKDAYYFPHDSNAKNDPKIIRLLQKHDWQGYGIYWALIEMLRENDTYELPSDYGVYAYALRVDDGLIKSIIEDFDLFTISDGIFFSQSLKNRMKKFDKRKDQARKAANIRWAKNADAMQAHSGRNASIVNKSIVNKKRIKKKGIDIPDFIPNDLWSDFLKHRKVLKKPMTVKAEKILINKISKLKDQGYNPVDLLETAIERGWQTVYEPENRWVPKKRELTDAEKYGNAPPAKQAPADWRGK